MEPQKKMTILFLMVVGIATILNFLNIFKVITNQSSAIGFMAVLICTISIGVLNIFKNKKSSVINEVVELFENKLEVKWVRLLLCLYILLWGLTYLIAGIID